MGGGRADTTATSKPLDQTVEKETKQFYDAQGWVEDEQGKVKEDILFRHYGDEHGEYRKKIGSKPANLLKDIGGTVLLAGPGDLPASHLLAASHFDKVICIDISEKSIEHCKNKLGDKGTYCISSLVDIPLESNSVDAILCTHVIYHIDKDLQKKTVDEFIRVTRPGGRIVIVCCNSRSPFMILQGIAKLLGINKLTGKDYLYTHFVPLSWWKQFSQNKLDFHPNSAISANQAKYFLPSSRLRRAFYNFAMTFEDKHPKLAAHLWTYLTVQIEPRD